MLKSLLIVALAAVFLTTFQAANADNNTSMTSSSASASASSSPSMHNDHVNHKVHCPRGFHMVPHDVCKRTIIINKTIHTHSSTSSNNLSNACFKELQFVWLAKIKRGANPQIDTIIDNCLNIS